MAARLWQNTVMNCSSLHGCRSKFITGIAYIHSRIIRPSLSKCYHTNRRFAKTLWPMIRVNQSCKAVTGPFCRMIWEPQRLHHQRFPRNILAAVPCTFAKKKYSCPAHDSITKYKNLLKHEDFIFYEKTTENGDDFKKFKNSFLQDFLYIEDFISPEEESCLLYDVEKALKRLKYEYDHWDGVIYGYRELEKSRWELANQKVIQRVKDKAFDDETTMLPGVHVLDLFKDGYIKPHVDSKFCGRRIAGVSLLSTAVMRLKPNDSDSYSFFVDVLLKPRSLYIMRDYARYELTHEVLPDDISYFGDKRIIRDRRIAVVMREEPTTL